MYTLYIYKIYKMMFLDMINASKNNPFLQWFQLLYGNFHSNRDWKNPVGGISLSPESPEKKNQRFLRISFFGNSPKKEGSFWPPVFFWRGGSPPPSDTRDARRKFLGVSSFDHVTAINTVDGWSRSCQNPGKIILRIDFEGEVIDHENYVFITILSKIQIPI